VQSPFRDLPVMPAFPLHTVTLFEKSLLPEDYRT
jgi:hypothetical protein